MLSLVMPCLKASNAFLSLGMHVSLALWSLANTGCFREWAMRKKLQVAAMSNRNLAADERFIGGIELGSVNDRELDGRLLPYHGIVI